MFARGCNCNILRSGKNQKKKKIDCWIRILNLSFFYLLILIFFQFRLESLGQNGGTYGSRIWEKRRAKLHSWASKTRFFVKRIKDAIFFAVFLILFHFFVSFLISYKYKSLASRMKDKVRVQILVAGIVYVMITFGSLLLFTIFY